MNGIATLFKKGIEFRRALACFLQGVGGHDKIQESLKGLAAILALGLTMTARLFEQQCAQSVCVDEIPMVE
ncbi:hypothetical protein ACFB49_30730 [Sphingomonas sp. DBB INV C78]